MTPKRVLMCSPAHYGIKYEINPWMSTANQPEQKIAFRQWISLKNALEESGFSVSLITQKPRLPDMVFTANAGLVANKTIILSKFTPPERQQEIKYFRDWFLLAGYQFKNLPADAYFEGEGDALWVADKLVCGYGIRSSAYGARCAAELAEAEPVLLKLVDERFYHLDTCFCYCPKKKLIICYLDAFDAASQLRLERIGEILPVSEYDAKNFVCNAIPVGQKIITGKMSGFLRNVLESRYGIEPIELAMSEFIKAGGAAKCLTLYI